MVKYMDNLSTIIGSSTVKMKRNGETEGEIMCMCMQMCTPDEHENAYVLNISKIRCVLTSCCTLQYRILYFFLFLIHVGEYVVLCSNKCTSLNTFCKRIFNKRLEQKMEEELRENQYELKKGEGTRGIIVLVRITTYSVLNVNGDLSTGERHLIESNVKTLW